jgi:hypothetical protein
MNIEAKKLNLIERFMKIKQEQSIFKFEALLIELEMEACAENSKKDIESGNVRLYDNFSNDVKQWLKNKTTK